MTHNELTRGAVAYVRYIDGKQPNRIRAWPAKAPEGPEGPKVGLAPERSAMLLLDVDRVVALVNGKPKTFSNPHSDSSRRRWWYVRAYDGEKKAVVEGWTLEGESGDAYLALLQPRNVCKIMMNTWLQSYVRGGTRVYVASDDALRMREQPSTNSAQVGSLAPGSIVKAGGKIGCNTADGRVWRLVAQGWVCESEDVEDSQGEYHRAWYLLPLAVSDVQARSTSAP